MPLLPGDSWLSALLLVGIPIGTLLGGLMIWHLTEYRAAFVRGGLRRAT